MMRTLPNGCWFCCKNIKWLVQDRQGEFHVVMHEEMKDQMQHHPEYSAPIKLVSYTWVACECESNE